jgi:hypothetical protein
MQSFIVEDEKAYKYFQQETFDKGTKVYLIKLGNKTTAKEFLANRTVTDVEVRGMGFDGYLSDFIKGPDAVLAAAFNQTGIHITVSYFFLKVICCSRLLILFYEFC